MNRERHTTGAPTVGGSSLVVIFAVLCLTVFALLGLSVVRADQRLADAGRKAVSDFYAADTQAELLLARLRAGELPEGVTAEGDLYRYACRVSDTQVLIAEVRISGAEWDVLRWQLVSTTEWQENDDLSVWSGE